MVWSALWSPNQWSCQVASSEHHWALRCGSSSSILLLFCFDEGTYIYPYWLGARIVTGLINPLLVLGGFSRSRVSKGMGDGCMQFCAIDLSAGELIVAYEIHLLFNSELAFSGEVCQWHLRTNHQVNGQSWSIRLRCTAGDGLTPRHSIEGGFQVIGTEALTNFQVVRIAPRLVSQPHASVPYRFAQLDHSTPTGGAPAPITRLILISKSGDP